MGLQGSSSTAALFYLFTNLAVLFLHSNTLLRNNTCHTTGNRVIIQASPPPPFKGEKAFNSSCNELNNVNMQQLYNILTVVILQTVLLGFESQSILKQSGHNTKIFQKLAVSILKCQEGRQLLSNRSMEVGVSHPYLLTTETDSLSVQNTEYGKGSRNTLILNLNTFYV